MTEAEWLSATDPTPMLLFLRGKASDRKLRLFACACARDVEEATKGEVEVSVPELAERYADGQASAVEIGDALARVEDAAFLQPYQIGDAFGVLEASLLPDAYRSAAEAAMWLKGYYSYESSASHFSPTAFCRDIFGNPFRPVTFSPEWRTSTVLALTEGIYAERAFDRLPILADAFQEAGCDSDDVLAHCRGDGPHVRGCWVVDAVLGKE